MKAALLVLAVAFVGITLGDYSGYRRGYGAGHEDGVVETQRFQEEAALRRLTTPTPQYPHVYFDLSNLPKSSVVTRARLTLYKVGGDTAYYGFMPPHPLVPPGEVFVDTVYR